MVVLVAGEELNCRWIPAECLESRIVGANRCFGRVDFARFLTTTTRLTNQRCLNPNLPAFPAAMGAGWQRCRLRGGSFLPHLRRYGVGGGVSTMHTHPSWSRQFDPPGGWRYVACNIGPSILHNISARIKNGNVM
jgi:hypothetical protein